MGDGFYFNLMDCNEGDPYHMADGSVNPFFHDCTESEDPCPFNPSAQAAEFECELGWFYQNAHGYPIGPFESSEEAVEDAGGDAMSKNITGPWEVETYLPRGSADPCLRISDEKGALVAWVDTGDAELDEKHARLIAAAPDLLDALQHILDLQDGSSLFDGGCLLSEQARDYAGTAIAKATR